MIKARQRYRTKVEREAMLEEFLESGLSQRGFCEAWGIGVRTLQSWRRKVEEESQESEEEVPGVAAFLEVKLEASGGGLLAGANGREKARYEVVLRDGKRLVIGSGFAAAEVAALIGILEAQR